MTLQRMKVASLRPLGGNPRRGDVAAIAESLEAFGQYQPIVVRKSTSEVLCGNHTLAAAKQLGWSHVDANVVDVSDDEAKRIALADNQTHSRGGYYTDTLREVLDSLPDLDATGYTRWDVPGFGDGIDFGGHKEEGWGRVDETKGIARIQIGVYRLQVAADAFSTWLGGVGDTPASTIAELLGLTIDPTQQTRTYRSKPPTTAPQTILTDATQVRLDTLVPYEKNPRKGDVSAIQESLAVNGQYRPIVVRAQTNEVLRGNHTLEAARRLGWSDIAVVYVECDDDKAQRLVLMDNKTSDRGSDDPQSLVEFLASLDDLAGTGYDDQDVELLLRHLGHKPPPPPTNVVVYVGPVEFKTSVAAWQQWNDAMQAEYGYTYEEVGWGIGARLGLPDDYYKPVRRFSTEA